MNKADSIALMWFRRDLRLTDNATLYQALTGHENVIPVFIFDETILSQLPKNDRRLTFIDESLTELADKIAAQGGRLQIYYGNPIELIPQLALHFNVGVVYAGEDYEPYARKRDAQVAQVLAEQKRRLQLIKDQVVFAKDEVLSQKGTPLTVFTPYKNAWLKRLSVDDLTTCDTAALSARWYAADKLSCQRVTLESLGVERQSLVVKSGETGAQLAWQDFQQRMAFYKDKRDFPGVKGVSYLSVHLRFGTISVRQLALAAWMQGGEGANTWLSELIWREFYMQFIYHHPNVAYQAYKAEWREQPWENRADWYAAWCEGRTGYPIVDAAMRQLNQTGFMHNRLRMIAAAFLIKDLDINWQWGEAYFAQQLLDFDLAANNGGWQWASSTGCDAAQPFRIFNPVLQSEKFDADGKFIKKYVPELSKLEAKLIHAPWKMSPTERQSAQLVLGKDYPFPLVDHDVARKKALQKYANIKQMNETDSNFPIKGA